MKMIKITCQQCHSPFERELRSYNQNIKKSQKMFCSRKCNIIYSNLNRGRDWYLKYIPTIQLDPGNRKDEYSPFKYYITKCIERKKYSGVDFDIDAIFLKNLWDSQKGICPYTKIKMILPETTRNHSTLKSLKKASLDRIDSSQGYIKGNVEFVCLFINFAKNSYSKSDVMDFIIETKCGTPGGI